MRLSLTSLAIAAFASVTLAACGSSSGHSSGGPGSETPLSDEQAVQFGMIGPIQDYNGLYSGDLTLTFEMNGTTTTQGAGTLSVSFEQIGDQLTLDYNASAGLVNRYSMTVVDHVLYSGGRQVGQGGAFALVINDQNWRYTFLRVTDQASGKRVVRVTATSTQGGETAKYVGVLFPR